MTDDDVEEILYQFHCLSKDPVIIAIDLQEKGINVNYKLVSNICSGKCRLSYFNDIYGERSSTSGNTYSFIEYLIHKHNLREGII